MKSESPWQISVMLVDDHELYRGALRDAINSEADLLVVVEAGSISEALELQEKTGVEVAVVDRRLPDGDGVDLCHTLVGDRHIPCIMITASIPEAELLESANQAGVFLLMQKGPSVEFLATAIRQAASSGA